MKELKEIRDDQIRIIGGEGGNKKPLLRIIIIAVLSIAITAVVIFFVSKQKEEVTEIPEPALFEPVRETVPTRYGWIGRQVDPMTPGYTEIRDTLVNDIPLRIYIPHNAELTLHVGTMDREDKSVVYAAQAADVRADNGGIVGAFVLKGEPLAWGLSKKGFCASINGEVTIGVADNSPLFEKATEEGGYFFRQYPLVSNGEVIDNEPKGKSIRRAICDRQAEIFMVETGTTESFHDFAQALADLGVDQAVYLVGSTAYGWALDETGAKHEFGKDEHRRMPENTSYIVWRKYKFRQ